MPMFAMQLEEPEAQQAQVKVSRIHGFFMSSSLETPRCPFLQCHVSEQPHRLGAQALVLGCLELGAILAARWHGWSGASLGSLSDWSGYSLGSLGSIGSLEWPRCSLGSLGSLAWQLQPGDGGPAQKRPPGYCGSRRRPEAQRRSSRTKSAKPAGLRARLRQAAYRVGQKVSEAGAAATLLLPAAGLGASAAAAAGVAVGVCDYGAAARLAAAYAAAELSFQGLEYWR